MSRSEAIPREIPDAGRGTLGFAGVLVYGGGQIIDGDKSVGEFMSFFTAMGLLFEPVRRVANVSGTWQMVRASLERIHSVFHVGPTITSPVEAKEAPEAPASADIVFEDVVVNYGAESALAGTSFTARAGETTALVGASGAGKSTILKTVMGLIEDSIALPDLLTGTPDPGRGCVFRCGDCCAIHADNDRRGSDRNPCDWIMVDRRL